MRTYYNVKNESFIHRNRPESVILNTALCESVIISAMNKRELREMEGQTIFFTVPNWLMKKKDLKSIFLTGKITEVSESGKAVQLNFSKENWFPVSQMYNVYIYKPKKPKQKLLTEYEER